ncbi:MAG: UDP-glucose 4-epimerase [Frankiaceae bacterium]|nr:UDP-glucose 4-epimerase [Frankiaceae bacterium]
MQCVVGPDGFLGSALVRHLEAHNTPVTGFRRSDAWRLASGARSPAAEADVVYWLAGSVNPATADSHPERIEADFVAVREFAHAVAGANVRRVVLASSGGTVYDTGAPPPYDESAATAPLSTYGRHKLELEQVLSEALPGDVELAILRIGNAYGPGQPVGTGQGVIAYWLDAALNGRPLVLFGEPDTSRDFTYIDDLASALAHFAQAPLSTPRAVFNIGSGQATELGELASTIMAVVGEDHLALETLPARPFDVPHIWLDVTRASESGWQARTPLVTGIERSWHALRSARAAV